MDRQTLLDFHYALFFDIVALQKAQSARLKEIAGGWGDRVGATREAGRIDGYLDVAQKILNELTRGEKDGVSKR